MGIELAKAFITVRADSKKLPADLNRVKSSVSRTMASIVSIAKTASKAIAAVAAVAAVVGARQIISMAQQRIALAERQIDAEQRLAAVVRATGKAAGFEASQLRNFASELQKSTTVGDEAILESMAILLTFRSIAGDAFKETTRLALDMAAVMGSDAKGAVLQLGKALEDPVGQLGALGRTGITFSGQQKEQIKGLVQANKLFEAQGIILGVIRAQLGGVAEALADTPAGKVKQLTNELDDLKEELGRKLLPLQAEWLQTMIDLQPAMADIGLALADFAKELGPVVKDMLPDLLVVLGGIMKVGSILLKFTFIPLRVVIGALGFVFRSLADAINGATEALADFGLVDRKSQSLKTSQSFVGGGKAKQGGVAGDTAGHAIVGEGIFGGLATAAPGEDFFGLEDFDRQMKELKRSQFPNPARRRATVATAAAAARPPTTQKGTLQEGLGGGFGFGALTRGIGIAVAGALMSPPVVEAMSRPALDLASGRSGFAEFGTKIQDALLQADKDVLDKQRNSMLGKQVTLSEQIVKLFGEDRSRGALK